MKTNLSHIPEHKQAELKAIVAALIPKYAEIEMIILYGSYARGNWVEDKYVENGVTYEYKSDYDLLVVLSTNGKANADSFLQSVSQKLEELKLDTPVHPIFHGIEFLNEALREGNYFFGDIKREGIVLLIPAVLNWTTSARWLRQKCSYGQNTILINGLIVLMCFLSITNMLSMMAI